ncbi:13410_t:CDS:2 [Entrophospora sp. SA101]|nr:13410_t:CDS:2 [Entrophospora sp. SA101]
MSKKIQCFHFSEYTPEDLNESNLCKEHYFIFDTYQNRSEINQNLSNAPSSSIQLAPSNQNEIDFSPVMTPTTFQSSNNSSTLPSRNHFWNPTHELYNLLNEFNNKILLDYPKVPCAYCSILLMENSTKWSPYNEDERYPLTRTFPQVKLCVRTNRKVLSPIPPELEYVPMLHCKYLSPIYLGCSLGHEPGSNKYANYPHMQGFFTHPPDLVVPNDAFPPETHNEDASYNHLIAGTLKLKDQPDALISFNNKNLEAYIFPDLFPTGQGHYEDIRKLLNFKPQTDSYGNNDFHPTQADLIAKSAYTNRPIIDETKTTSMPSSLHTAAPYFKKRQQHLFDIDESDEYRKHVLAQRLGTMELMVLLLQYPLTRCSVSVQYFPSAPSELRT